jgi:hypothetical protein
MTIKPLLSSNVATLDPSMPCGTVRLRLFTDLVELVRLPAPRRLDEPRQQAIGIA